MNIGIRHSAAAMASLSLLVSMALAGWHQLNSGTAAVLMSVHFPEGTQVGYAVGTDPVGGATIVKTTDGGETWVLQNSGVMNGLNAVYFKDNNNGFAVGLAGTAIRTTDGGSTWSLVSVPSGDELSGVQFPEKGQIGYILIHTRNSQQSRVLKTTDGGSNWIAINVGGPASVAIGGGFANDSVGVAVGEEGLVLGTRNGFGTFSYQGAQTNADLIAAAFSPDDPEHGYLIGNDSTRGLIRHTDDGGATLWDSVRCYPVTAFYGMDVPTSNYACVCGSGGKVLRSFGHTEFWMTMPTGVTADLYGVCFPNGADTGFVVGAGGTILKTYDGGGIIFSVDEGRSRMTTWTGLGVLHNPSRHGITLHADVDVDVVVFDAVGRAVASRALTKGLNFLPLSKAGVYMVRITTEGSSMTQKLVVEH